MIISKQKITIISTVKPRTQNVNDELRWFGASLGLFNLRDKDMSCFRIFIELLKAAKKRIHLSSDELAYKLNLSRGTVMHHINRLMGSGIVISDKNRYSLRVENLDLLIDELEKDFARAFSELKSVAKDIDKHLGID